MTRLDDFEVAGEQAERLRAALAEVAAGDDSFETLDERDDALRKLWVMGASRKALTAFAGMSPNAIAAIVRGTRPAGRGTRTHVSALLLTLAELS